MEKVFLFKEFLMGSKTRFLKQDWGDISDREKEANDRAVVMGSDILGMYKMEGQPGKEIVIVAPYPRGYLQILMKKELETFKNKQHKFVLYDSNGKPLSC